MPPRHQDLPARATCVDAVILALDSSKASTGAAIFYPKHVLNGELSPQGAFNGGYRIAHPDIIKTQALRKTYVELGMQGAQALNVPLLVVAEKWTPHGVWGFDTVLGMGEGWGWWSSLFHDDLHPSQIIRIEPNQWRNAIFGKRRPKDREQLKALACQYVRARFHFETVDDVAEAICIGLCGAQLELAHVAVEKWHRRQKKT